MLEYFTFLYFFSSMGLNNIQSFILFLQNFVKHLNIENIGEIINVELSYNIDNDTQTMHKDVPIIYFEFFLFLVMFPWNGLQKTKGIQVSLLCTWTA